MSENREEAQKKEDKIIEILAFLCCFVAGLSLGIGIGV